MIKYTSITLLTAFCLGSISIASCKKDFTCTCKDIATDSTIARYAYPKMKKKSAENECNRWNTAIQATGGSCSIQ